MRKIVLFSAFLFLLFFIFTSFSSRPTFAVNNCPAGTCSSTCCNDSYSAPKCNGTTCQTQGYYCSAGKCVYGWAGGQPSSACSPACSGGTVPTPTPSSSGSCPSATIPVGAERCLNLTTPQTCTSTGWRSGTGCTSGFYCRTTTLNQVSCIKGCLERGYSCIEQDACDRAFGIVLSSTYYCSNSATICCQLTTVTPTLPPSGSGYDCKDSGCVPHTGAGSGVYTTEFACAKDCKSELYPGCPICNTTFSWNWLKKKCVRVTNGVVTEQDPTSYQTCSSTQLCSPGCGCNCNVPKGFTGSGSLPCGEKGIECETALGNIKLDPVSLVKDFFGIVLSISGGIAVLLIILSGYRLIASQGNPEKINEAKEHLTAAIIGLLFVIFSFSILRFIGVDVLGIFP